MSLENLLKERKCQHGDFEIHSRISQKLKNCLFCQDEIETILTAAQKESLEMICHKMARIIAGDPNHIDHWNDIAGYATLVANILEDNKENEGLSNQDLTELEKALMNN